MQTADSKYGRVGDAPQKTLVIVTTQQTFDKIHEMMLTHWWITKWYTDRKLGISQECVHVIILKDL